MAVAAVVAAAVEVVDLVLAAASALAVVSVSAEVLAEVLELEVAREVTMVRAAVGVAALAVDTEAATIRAGVASSFTRR